MFSPGDIVRVKSNYDERNVRGREGVVVAVDRSLFVDFGPTFKGHLGGDLIQTRTGWWIDEFYVEPVAQDPLRKEILEYCRKELGDQ